MPHAEIPTGGTFATWAAVVVLMVSVGKSQPLTVDLDGDGRLDVVVPDAAAPQGFFVSVADGSLSPTSPAAPSRRAPDRTAPRLIVCDWNNDRLPDVITHRNGEPLSLWLNYGGRRFARDERFAELLGSAWQSVTIADLANSPYPSFLGTTDSLTLVIVERRDARSFERSSWQMPERGPVAVYDANGDGRLDVVVGSRVRLRTMAGWSDAWLDRRTLPLQPTTRLRLVGPPENPRSVGARLALVTPSGDQTHWLYPPRWNAADPVLELVIPTRDGRSPDGEPAGLIIRWPDGTYAMTAQRLPVGDCEVRALPPVVDAAGVGAAADSRSRMRWRLSSPVTPVNRGFWTVVRTGAVGDPQLAKFDESGLQIDWRSERPLEPGESCILSYAGNPVSVRTVTPAPTRLLPLPVVRDSVPRAQGVVVADGDGDGMADLVYRLGALEPAAFRTKPVSALLTAPMTPGYFVGTRPGHRMWWHIVQAALRRDRPAAVGDEDELWVDGTAPADIRDWQRLYADVTGDGRLDCIALSPRGVVKVYEGTDGRPSGRHLTSGGAHVGPVGPGETAVISVANPLRGPFVISSVTAEGPLGLGDMVLPMRADGGDTLRLPVAIAPRQHEGFVAGIVLVSEQVDRSRTTIPVRVTIGVPWDAPAVNALCDLGVVQRDSVVRASVRVPWVRLPQSPEVAHTLESGEARVTVSATDTEQDTVRLGIDFVALAVGDVSIRYPMRRGEVLVRATAVDTMPPPPPIPSARLRRDTVVVCWLPVDVPDLDHYEVERREQVGSRRWVVELDTAWFDPGLSEGQRRSYVVTAVDMTGNRGISEAIHVRRPDGTPPTITLIDPLPDARDVGLRQPINFVVTDSLTGVSPDSLRLWVGGDLVAVEHLRIEKSRYRWSVSYRPTMWPMGARVVFTVSAADSGSPPNVRRWTGSFTTVADTVVAVPRLIGRPPVLGQGGVVRVALSLPSDRELVGANLVIRPAGSRELQTLRALVRGQQVEVDVPPALSPPSGFFYRWVFQTNRRTYEWPDPGQPWKSWKFQLSEEASFWPRSGSRGSGRTLLASPVIAADGDALSLLRADLRHAGGTVRLYGYDAIRQRWVSQGDVGPLGIGEAIVMTWQEAAPVVQTSGGETVALDTAQTIALHPRWNLIGQPFPYPVSWRKVRAANPDLPVSGPWVEREELALTDVWNAWEGAWVYLASARARELVVPPGDTMLAEADRAPVRRTGPVWFAASEKVRAQTSALLVVSARSANRAVSDIALGWNAEASATYDPLDIPAPPTPDSALVVRFPHHDWQQHPGSYAVDMRDPAEGGVWRIAIDADGRSQVLLDLEFVVPPPPGITADLIDLMAQDSLRLSTTTTSYALRDVSRFPMRELVIVLGDDQFRQSLERESLLAPSKLILYPTYPNPFNRETTITYSVPAQSEGADRLRIVIYNMLGQPVRVLRDGDVAPGVHTVAWDALDDQGSAMSSGLYFCELTWGRERRLQRLIYLR